jgi:DNA-binding LacI/PurR family transcriptional regulator/serine phosphatase RsbU (regulator of sigma subunit)
MRACTIGIMCDAVNEWYQNTVFLGADAALRELGATVVVYNGGILRSRDPSESDRNTLFDLIDPRRLDGLLVVGPVADHVGNRALSAFCWRYARLPIVTLAIDLPGRPAVLVDNLGGMGKLVEHLVLDHGKRRIAFVRGPVANAEAAGRYAVYREVIERYGIAFDPRLVALGDFRAPSGAEAVRVLCDERQARFDALIAANDNMALGAMEALQARGIEVPGQVGVAGFDDMEEGRFATPPLTTVKQPIDESARRAAQLVVSLVRNERAAARVTLETQVVLRESCGCNVDEVVVSRGPAAFLEVESLAAYVTERRAAIVSALKRTASVEPGRVPDAWAETLVDAFAADLRGEGHRFVSSLLATLRRVIATGGSVRPWQVVVSVIRSAVMGAHGDADGLRRARDLLHAARVLVGDLHERAQALHRIAREDWIRRLHETSEVLTKAFGEGALVEAVASQLPRWNIPAAVIALYENGQGKGMLRARPLFVYDGGRRAPCDPSRSFDAAELAPDGWFEARRRTVVVEPLVYRGEQFGFSVFEVGPVEGEVYEWLRRLLSSAMKGARLMEQVVDGATSRQRAERERLEKEMEIAARIQTSLVSKTVAVPGLDIATAMLPATEVGGDYYDVVPFDGGCWIGIGDVAGHGLQTGLVMLIIQSVLGSLVRQEPGAPPREAMRIVNAVMFDSVRRRMGQDEHATLLLLRYDDAGGVRYAGAHEEIIVRRAALGRCERIETLGPVFGAVADLGETIAEASFTLESGDLLVLYTDGLIEAMNDAGETFGVERVCDALEEVAERPVEAVRDHVIAAVRRWMAAQRDDISLVVVRRR